MIVANEQVAKSTENARTELYKLIGEGYQAMIDNRVNTIDEVRKELELMRKKLG